MQGNRLAGKVAIITGGGSGIGAATAARFCQEGAAVLIVDWNAESAARVARELAAGGANVGYRQGDVQDEATAAASVRAALDSWGRLDIVVNNAAVPGDIDLLAFTGAQFDRLLGVNLKGPLFFCQHAVPVLRAAGGGAIVNVASISATCGIPGQPLYAASKGALAQLTRQLAIEYAADHIRVNAVAPGVIDTPMLSPTNDDVEGYTRFLEMLRGRHPLGRFGRPDEVAAAILFLASEEASFVTGASLAVDGGYTAQ